MKGIMFKEWKHRIIANIPSGFFFQSDDGLERTIHPRYQVGEVVYIKEMWCPLASPSYGILNGTMPTVYKQEMDEGGATLPKKFKWRSPLFMPAWAARYFIKITGNIPELFILRKLTAEELEKEGGQAAIQYLRQYDGKWVWVYTFRKVEK